MTTTTLEKKWQELSMDDNGEKRETLNEFIANWGEAWELDEFLCNLVELKHSYGVENQSVTDETSYIITANTWHEIKGKKYMVQLDQINLKGSTTDEIIADLINRNELITL